MLESIPLFDGDSRVILVVHPIRANDNLVVMSVACYYGCFVIEKNTDQPITEHVSYPILACKVVLIYDPVLRIRLQTNPHGRTSHENRICILHYTSLSLFMPTQRRMMHRSVQVRSMTDQQWSPRNVLITTSLHSHRRHRSFRKSFEDLLRCQSTCLQESLICKVQSIIHRSSTIGCQ